MADSTVIDNIRYWSDREGGIFWAPLQTALPETPFEALDPAFVPIGSLTEDGPTEGVSVDSEKLKIWGGNTGRIKVTGTEKTIQFTALEDKPLLAKLFWNAKAIVVKGAGATQFAEFEIPDSFRTVEGAVVVVFRDGEYMKIRRIGKAQISDRGDISNSNSDPSGFELTLDVLSDDSVLTTSPGYFEEGISKTSWTVTVTGAPAGGTFSLAVNGYSTAPIAHDAAAGAVQAAINGLSGVTGVTVTGAGTYSLTFTEPVELTADGTLLTGGTNPGVTVA